MNYKPNTWVNFDGYVSLVVDVWQGYYEPFDAEVVDGEKRCGQRRYRQIVLRDLFDDYGRRLAGVPAMKYLEAIADYLQPSNEEDQRRIDRFRTAHPDEYRHNELRISDRYGKVVFHVKNYDTYAKNGQIFPGTNPFDGKDLSDGVYYYVFSYKGKAKTFQWHGSITIIR